uniref:Uncharacterized protein n=1 Tax=Ralstonia solanacearum TaxID=305 RepID=A0A0S4X474_RALSL|nr:protein of unknown function [Ralstonia solanacearum]
MRFSSCPSGSSARNWIYAHPLYPTGTGLGALRVESARQQAILSFDALNRRAGSSSGMLPRGMSYGDLDLWTEVELP